MAGLATGAQAQTQPAPAKAAAAPAGDPKIGARLFIQCRACHTIDAGGKNLVGPNLSNIMGAKSAAKNGFTYSPALRKAALTWDAATMDAWLQRPNAVVPGTTMVFAGMPNPKARADMIAFLQTLGTK